MALTGFILLTEGAIIVSGAAGSGESTLIAGFTVDKLLDPHAHCNIAEGAAPIEFLLDRMKSPSSTINQTEIPRICPRSRRSFAAACGASRRTSSSANAATAPR